MLKHNRGWIVVIKSRKGRKVEFFDKAISIPPSSYYSNKPRIARCRVCDGVAHYRVTRDMNIVSKVEYYCKSCANRLGKE